MKFPTILSQLRHEKDISQRQAAQELEISQSLLSHYENGIREPGLEFIKKACDYYDVSADFMLGRTMIFKDKSEIEEIIQYGRRRENDVVVLCETAVDLIFKILQRLGGDELILDAAGAIGAEIYKLFRNIVALSDDKILREFSVPEDRFQPLSDVEMRLSEIRFYKNLDKIRDEMETTANFGKYMEDEFPELCGYLKEILQRMDSRIAKLVER